MINTIIRKFAGTLEQSKLLVFNFHNIFTSDDLISKNSIDRKTFTKQIKWINTHFEIVPLAEGIQSCRAGKLVKPSACITFDDGYLSHLTIAANLLKQLNLPATFFVSSGHLDGVLWNDYLELFLKIATKQDKKQLELLIKTAAISNKNSTYPQKSIEDKVKYLTIDSRKPILEFIETVLAQSKIPQIMLNEENLLTLAAMGFDIGGHTFNHPILSIESNSSAQKEIATDLDKLSSTLNKPINKFAYPNGKPILDYRDAHIEMLMATGVSYAAISNIGAFHAGSDMLQIPRVNLNGKRTIGYLRTILSAYNTQPTFVEAFGYEK